MSPLCCNSYNLHNALLIIKGLIETLHSQFKFNQEGGLGKMASQPADRAARKVVSAVFWSRGGGY